jgi:hypothetical protein
MRKDSDPDPGGPKTYGSGSGTLHPSDANLQHWVYRPPRLQSKIRTPHSNFKHNIFSIKITNVINDHLGITRLTTRVGGKYQILECFHIIKIKQNLYYLP